MPDQQVKALVQTAVTCRARPRRIAPGVRGAHRDPDLLEWAPVIRRSLVAEEPAAVPLLEGEIHLEPAPVRAPGIGPAALVMVDAEPASEVGWMLGVPPRAMRAVLPAPSDPPEPFERAGCKQARNSCRRTAVYHRQPALRLRAKVPDMATPSGRLPNLPRRGRLPGLGGGDCRARGRSRTELGVSRGRGGRRRSGDACEREQQPAGQDEAPQCFSSLVDCKSEAERAGKTPWGEHRSARLMRSFCRE
jgi:hypothetical protein